jgi:RNA polymerase sigma-70 factor, ECF subfamily
MFRRRQPDGFADQVVAHLPPLYATALRLARNRPDADDLVQDTMVKALRAAHRFTPGTNLRAWLYTILHNTWKNRRRDAARAPVAADSERVDEAADTSAPGGTIETPEQVLLRTVLDADLQEALGELPEVFREAVWLRDVEEFSYAEMAGMLDIPIGTVMSRISRGRRLLAARLAALSPRADVQLESSVAGPARRGGDGTIGPAGGSPNRND